MAAPFLTTPPPLVKVEEVHWNVISDAPLWYQKWLTAKVAEWTAELQPDDD
jgi:hypothetical protein